MPRLIDATRIEQYILNHCSDNEEINAIYAEIINAPTVDAEPVRHGRWEEENTRTHSMQFKCSVCGGIAYYPQNHHSAGPKRCGYAYCPNCGAKMDDIDEMPTVEAEPVRHGRWIVHTVKGESGAECFGCAECSVCGDIYSEVTCIGLKPVWDYCPNCGAKMDDATQKSVGNALDALDEESR